MTVGEGYAASRAARRMPDASCARPGPTDSRPGRPARAPARPADTPRPRRPAARPRTSSDLRPHPIPRDLIEHASRGTRPEVARPPTPSRTSDGTARGTGSEAPAVERVRLRTPRPSAAPRRREPLHPSLRDSEPSHRCSRAADPTPPRLTEPSVDGPSRTGPLGSAWKFSVAAVLARARWRVGRRYPDRRRPGLDLECGRHSPSRGLGRDLGGHRRA